MQKNFRTIKIGHGAYNGANALKFVVGKAAAVRELRDRGFTRDRARDIINDVSSRPAGYKCAEVEHSVVEVLAMNNEASWYGY